MAKITAANKLIQLATNRPTALLIYRAMSSKVTETKETSVTETNDTKVNYNEDGVGFKTTPHTKHVYLNPLLTPPPRSPRTPEDFTYPARLGHWTTLGYDWINPLRDKYQFHETIFLSMLGFFLALYGIYYGPDLKHKEWARREALFRIAKREALGLPLIDRNIVDPERVVLPTEEELVDFPVTM